MTQRADLERPPAPPRHRLASACARCSASHHAMWNYVTYRDAIALVGHDPDALYPEGTTRLPADWADLGWLTCFHGPPASAPSRRCAPRSCPTRSTSTRPT